MKLRVRRFLIFLALLGSACSQNGSDASRPGSGDAPPASDPDISSQSTVEAPLIEAPALVELEMLNELDGWGVSEAEIVRTTDGGVTWYNVTPPEIAETGFSVDTFFLDQDHAWMQRPDFENFPNSGYLYHTSNSGLDWKIFPVPFSRADLHFLNEEHGWALADLGVGAGSNAVAVFQTSDGGITWEKTYTNDPNDSKSTSTLPLGGLKSGLIPLDTETAWVHGVIYAPGEAYLNRTDDGGRTWNPVLLDLPVGAQSFELGIDEDQLKFVSDDDGFLALRMSGDLTQTAIYTTNDAGESWTLTPTILDGAGETVFLSAQEMIMYNGEQFYVTRDAGKTWVTVSPDIVFGESFANMEYANPTIGWVITVDPTTNHRSLYKTTDGGTTWFPVIR